MTDESNNDLTEAQVGAIFATICAECDEALELSSQSIEEAIRWLQRATDSNRDPRVAMAGVEWLHQQRDRVASMRGLIQPRVAVFREALVHVLSIDPHDRGTGGPH